jgi:K+-transporting ATPase KdpF subunit
MYFCIDLKQFKMTTTILSASSASFGMNISLGYIAGAAIALLIFGYLIYTLIKPDKF